MAKNFRCFVSNKKFGTNLINQFIKYLAGETKFFYLITKTNLVVVTIMLWLLVFFFYLYYLKIKKGAQFA